jgi:hypothetical protein
MRQWGFDLFDLTMRRYSTAALPAPFQWDGPAQTIFGRPYQGDAIYLRDPMATGDTHCMNLSPYKMLKLACLFECFGLPDHAAELVRANAGCLSGLCNPEELLDNLAKEVDPQSKDYAEYITKFSNDPTSFYPSRKVANSLGVLNENRYSTFLGSRIRRRLSGVRMRIGKLMKQLKQAITANQ